MPAELQERGAKLPLTSVTPTPVCLSVRLLASISWFLFHSRQPFFKSPSVHVCLSVCVPGVQTECKYHT